MTDTGIINGEPIFQAVTFARSESVKALVSALAKAQGAFTTIRKTNLAKVNPADGEKQGYTYRYAELADFIDACRKPLAEAGLAITQPATTDGRLVTVETTLWHESGEWMSNVFVLESASPSPQKIGSALTFARRYAYCALLGISAEKDDDDGRAAQEPDPAAPRAQTPPRQGQQQRRDRPPQQQRPESPRAPSDAAPPERPPKKRGPDALLRMRAECERYGLDTVLVEAVEEGGFRWDALPEDCGPIISAAWSVLGDRIKAAREAAKRQEALDGAETHNTPEAVAAKVAEIADRMSMPS
jgi:hypothetical protein